LGSGHTDWKNGGYRFSPAHPFENLDNKYNDIIVYLFYMVALEETGSIQTPNAKAIRLTNQNQ